MVASDQPPDLEANRAKPGDEPIPPPPTEPVQELSTITREMDALASSAQQTLATLPKPWKEDLSSPAGWRRLHDATFSDLFVERLSPDDIAKLRRSYVAWVHRYSRLRFITATRPVWNT